MHIHVSYADLLHAENVEQWAFLFKELTTEHFPCSVFSLWVIYRSTQHNTLSCLVHNALANTTIKPLFRLEAFSNNSKNDLSYHSQSHIFILYMVRKMSSHLIILLILTNCCDRSKLNSNISFTCFTIFFSGFFNGFPPLSLFFFAVYFVVPSFSSQVFFSFLY